MFCYCRCLLSMDSFRTISDFTKYLKKMTKSVILCSLPLDAVKTYIEAQYEKYLHGPSRMFNTGFLGLQSQTGVIVYSPWVSSNINLTPNTTGNWWWDMDVWLIVMLCCHYLCIYTNFMVGPLNHIALVTSIKIIIFRHAYLSRTQILTLVFSILSKNAWPSQVCSFYK